MCCDVLCCLPRHPSPSPSAAQKFLLSSDAVPTEAKLLFAAEEAGAGRASVGLDLLGRVQAALDVGKTGALTALQLDRASRHLAADLSLHEAVLLLAQQARLLVLPRPALAIAEAVGGLVFSEVEQRRKLK